MISSLEQQQQNPFLLPNCSLKILLLKESLIQSCSLLKAAFKIGPVHLKTQAWVGQDCCSPCLCFLVTALETLKSLGQFCTPPPSQSHTPDLRGCTWASRIDQGLKQEQGNRTRRNRHFSVSLWNYNLMEVALAQAEIKIWHGCPVQGSPGSSSSSACSSQLQSESARGWWTQTDRGLQFAVIYKWPRQSPLLPGQQHIRLHLSVAGHRAANSQA